MRNPVACEIGPEALGAARRSAQSGRISRNIVELVAEVRYVASRTMDDAVFCDRLLDNGPQDCAGRRRS
jgi:hypothetical protein